MSKQASKIDWVRIRIAVLSVVLACLLAPILQPRFHENEAALSVLVTTFSILAGFLIAVMAIVANDRALRGRNWRQDTADLVAIRQQLIRHQVLFVFYLCILGLAFVVAIKPQWNPALVRWLDYVLIAMSITALILSFRLPGQLTKQHLAQLEKTIRDRKRHEVGPDSVGPPDRD